jgi:hypothetical protein
VFCINLSGRIIPDEKIAPADLAVPYEAPITVRTIEAAQPRTPKNDCSLLMLVAIFY